MAKSKVPESVVAERENPRDILLQMPGLKEYRVWKKHPVTQAIINILREETRSPVAIPAAIVEPKVACAMYHHRVGVDWAIDIMKNLDVTQPINELEATYTDNKTGDE